MKYLLILISIIFISCGDTTLIKVLPDNFYTTNITPSTQIKIDNIFNDMSVKTKQLITLHKVEYNPNHPHCKSNPVAFDGKYKYTGVEWNIITFCWNPNTMDDYILEQTLYHELGHSICNLEHTEDGIMKAIGFLTITEWLNKEQYIDELVDICAK